ncbi:hypothetical protein WJX74_001409 [Apatococcus lobatus]|uniref:Vacuolar protein sorting-associated protein 35 n=1 Tax=Apatococcus lobatus TaxID=904363 RepID=A0AAW1REG9_9CHLO
MVEAMGLEEQARLLQEAGNAVKRNAFFMKKAMDEDNLREALRYSATLLGELRTPTLTPQRYYELYMQAFNELTHLQAFFREERRKGRSYADLYELVQHAGNVLPRLYLLCTVGSCYIRSKEAPAKSVLKDLVEMCKGVQHPIRGLFLRSYLCQVSRGLLPDVGSEFEGDGGSISDAIEFLLINFAEMNKLWCRMQHHASGRDRDRREQERQQLADLVGRNLTYVSQLDGLDFALYQEGVLARVMDQIVSCKDAIAQQYLMQCVIQGFPDDFHLGTLDSLLGILPDLQSGVQVHVVVSSLLDRLARFAASDKAVVDTFNQVDAFGKLTRAAAKVTESENEVPSGDVVAMHAALLSFTGAVYPDRLDLVNKVLTSAYQALEKQAPIKDAKAEKLLVQLLSTPLDNYDVVTVLELANYPSVMSLLRPAKRKEMAVKICQTILRQRTLVSSMEKVEMLLDFISPLVRDTEGLEDDDEFFEEEQNLLARLVHQLVSQDTDEHFELLRAARDRFNAGGPKRLRHTLAPLAFAALRLVRTIKEGTADSKKADGACKTVLQWIHGVAAQLAEVPAAEIALQLYLQAAHAASEVACLELIAYEFFEQAFILYEEAIPDSKAEVTALQSIVGVLHRCRVFTAESRDTLVHKATGYSAKLLKKPDQCRAVCACSHLFWQELPAEEEGDDVAEGVQPPVRDADNVMVCLKRALKIANSAQQQLAVVLKGDHTTPVMLFVEILNHYLFYFEQGNPSITTSVLQSLLELVANEMANENCQKDEALLAFYNSTRNHIAIQKDKGDELAQKFSSLQL